ncbi:unnamed protein product [Closterium sp. NIES-54]
MSRCPGLPQKEHLDLFFFGLAFGSIRSSSIGSAYVGPFVAPDPPGPSAPAAALTIAATAAATATAATAARACCATMASLRVLAFDHEGRPIQFDTWLEDLQLYLLSVSKDSVSLFDLASGTATAPLAIADSATRSPWLTRDAAARLAIRNHLPIAECAHFRQHRTAQTLYDTVVARYSLPATASLGRLLLPYLFPELSALATVKDLVSHLHASDARYCATVPTEDHFLSLDPTSLTVDLLDQHLPAAETSAVAVGAARGTPRTPFFEGCSPSPFAPSYASATAADVPGAENVGAASASAKRRNSKGKGGRVGGGGSGSGGGGSSGGSGGGGGGGGGGTGGRGGGSGGGGGGSGGSGSSGGSGTGGGRTGARRGGFRGGQRQQQQRRSETQSPQQLLEWLFQRGTSCCEAEIYSGAMAAQDLRWLTYLQTDLGEQPRSPPILYVDNNAMIALCQEHRIEHRTKHIALRYFLARELQQHGQLRLAYVATRANITDIFTKALPPGDHQRFSTV